MTSSHRFPYQWSLADGFPARDIPAHNSTVFGTFICGGGSTMGYKLAGFRHLGGVEIDPKVAATYRDNLHPENLYIEDLRHFNSRNDLPPELYNLDLLDGSPPCTTFSMSGKRENAWNLKKKFHEGQKEQTLDDLVFVYCDTIAKLKPRICLLENVRGLVCGNAKSYARRIISRLTESGYRVQTFVLHAANMGVPQLRARSFFIGLRTDLAATLPPLKLNFAEPPIPFGAIRDRADTSQNLSPKILSLWQNRRATDKGLSDVNFRAEGKASFFNYRLLRDENICNTITATNNNLVLANQPRFINPREVVAASTFPRDYKFASLSQLQFMCGMSVPPVMTANIAFEIYSQWLKPLKKGLN